LRHFAAVEHNGRIHAVATALVVAAAIHFRLSADEWRWIILAIALVWLAETLNTAIERLADAITIEPTENIGYAKDVAAGAVLAAAVVSTVIGSTIFLPRLAALAP
jgi:diacylglycerol kinase